MRYKLLFSITAFLVQIILMMPLHALSGENAKELKRYYTIQLPKVSQDLPKIIESKEPLYQKLVCQTYCSQHRMRTGVAELSWHTDQKALKSKQAIQVTVYKNGFDNRSFMLFDLDPEKLKLDDEMRKPVSPMVGLDGMKDVRSSQINLTGYSRGIYLPGLKNIKRGNLAIIENLEPGLVYRFRVLTKTSTGMITGNSVSCMAPVCPADIKKEE